MKLHTVDPPGTLGVGGPRGVVVVVVVMVVMQVMARRVVLRGSVPVAFP
jgi:hypothetical protein